MEYAINSWSCAKENRYYCFSIDDDKVLALQKGAGRVAFTSTAAWIANAAGVSDADALCQKEACAAGLTGASSCTDPTADSRHFKAWLMTATTLARSRFSKTGADYYRPDGVLWLRSSELAAKADANIILSTGLNLGAAANWLPSHEVWTGSTEQNCANWTSASSGSASRGVNVHTSVVAFDNGQIGCDVPSRHLYCFEE